MRIKLLIIISVLISQAQIVMSQEYQVRSPDGDMRMRILDNNGQLVYSVSFNRKEVISPSLLGLVVNGHDSGEKINVKSTNKSFQSEKISWARRL